MKEFILSIDIREIIYAFVGALGGFWLASQWERSSEKRKKKQSIGNLVDELWGIKQTICKNVLSQIPNNYFKSSGHFEEENKAFGKVLQLKYSIYIPIWDAMIGSGNLLDFKDEDYFDELIIAYTKIRKLNNAIEGLDSSSKPEEFKQCVWLCQNVNEKIEKLLEQLPKFASAINKKGVGDD